MGRKKKTFYKPSIQIETGNERYDNQAGRIEAINSWNDIEHDSEDEYYEKRGKILIDNDYSQNQDETESSEEEVFALQTGGTLSEEDESQGESQENDLMSSDDFDDFDSQTWGNHKKTYYDADELSDFDEAKEEEEEALRLQKKKISKMSEEDFFDNDGIGSISAMDLDKEDEKKLMERLNQEVQKISFEKGADEIQPKNQDHYSNLSRAEIVEILHDESPELIELLSEFKEKLSTLKDTLTPILEKAKRKRNIKDPAMKFLSIKYHTLSNYLTNISFYFFLKLSGTRHLRTHPVIDALVDLRTTLDKLEMLENKMEGVIKEFIDRLETDEQIDQSEKADKETKSDELPSRKQINSKVEEAKTKKSKEKIESTESKHKKKLGKEKKKEKSKKMKLQHEYISVDNDEEHVDDLSNMADTLIEPEFVSFKNMKKNKRIREDLDLGDLDALDDVDAEDKAQNRKSLRHYVTKIDQNLVKREKAIRLGGDTDIPYKDKDKSAIKPVDNQNNGDDLDDLDWNDDDIAAKDIEAEGDDEFYLTVRKTKRAKKEKKFEHGQLIENNKKIVYEEEVLPDGSKRQINYEILKNKGLTPRRKKDQRNPRVKHRNKYEKAKKKIKSIKRIVVQQDGPYGGEITGIKTNLSRSIKFND